MQMLKFLEKLTKLLIQLKLLLEIPKWIGMQIAILKLFPQQML